MDLQYALRSAVHDLSTLSLLKPRNLAVQGHLITMHQSGTHWLITMLCNALCAEYELPPLAHIRDRSLLGRPQDPIVHPDVPRLIQSHEIPSPIVHSRLSQRFVRFPKYVLLTRDLRAALVSYYEKHRDQLNMPFAEYLRHHGWTRTRVRRDLWHRIRFLNAWHRDRQRLPEGHVLSIRYEDMKSCTLRELRRVWEFFGFPSHDDAFFEAAIEASSKDRMARREDPQSAFRVVRQSRRHPFEWFSDEDREYFCRMTREHLRDSFGYDYSDWSVDIPQSVAA